jgi:hypothetical protein
MRRLTPGIGVAVSLPGDMVASPNCTEEEGDSRKVF